MIKIVKYIKCCAIQFNKDMSKNIPKNISKNLSKCNLINIDKTFFIMLNNLQNMSLKLLKIEQFENQQKELMI